MNKIYLLVVALSLMSFLLRGLPFIFYKALKRSHNIEAIGKQLPAYIMMLLVIYEIELASFTHWPYGLPQVLTMLVVLMTHLLMRQVLLSISIGTAVYIVLLNIF